MASTPPHATAALVDPPLSPWVIWAAGLLGTPVVGLGLYLLWRKRRPKAATQAGRAAGIGAVLWLLALESFGCLQGRAPAPRGPASLPTAARSPAPTAGAPTPSATGPRATPEQVGFTQIMIAYARPGGVSTVTRTRAAALARARDLIDRIRGGTSMESLLGEYTDDRGDDGKPFNWGTYSMARSQPAVESIKRAAFGLAVGQLAPEPVDSGYAYHVIRRDE